MCFFDIIIYVGWKLWKRTKFIKPEDVDFSDVAVFDAYEEEAAAQEDGKPQTFWKRISEAVWN